MLVEPNGGCCRACKGQLEIIEADDDTMTVQCTECGNSYLVEPDAFNDGAMHYWLHVQLEQHERRSRD